MMIIMIIIHAERNPAGWGGKSTSKANVLKDNESDDARDVMKSMTFLNILLPKRDTTVRA